MRAFPAYREGAPLNVPDRDLQDGWIRAMVNRQRALDFRDLDIANDPVSRDVQQTFIYFPFRFCHKIAFTLANQRPVISRGLVSQLFAAFFLQPGHLLRISCLLYTSQVTMPPTAWAYIFLCPTFDALFHFY